ncbi:MAG: hypothetical protein AAFZ07_30085, partial [Actinomycetota bacterium]
MAATDGGAFVSTRGEHWLRVFEGVAMAPVLAGAIRPGSSTPEGARAEVWLVTEQRMYRAVVTRGPDGIYTRPSDGPGFFEPIHVERLDGLGQLQRVALGQSHPAIDHYVAAGADGFAGAADGLDVFAHALASVGGAVGQGDFQTCVSEIGVLLEIIAGAIGRHALVD